MNIANVFLTRLVLNHFFAIELSSSEQTVAVDSVKNKYAKALNWTLVYVGLSIFPILFLDTSIIISVLIPITMVAGTAWFSISLANMKQKFGDFGLELTSNLFEAFAVSLGLLFALSVFSLASPFWKDTVAAWPNQELFAGISVIIGILTIGNIVFKIFIGSIKYDINDAMLTGQNEAAERFYRKSLSLLSSVADTLRSGKSLQVANYYIGVAFFEIFNFVKSVGMDEADFDKLFEETNTLVKHPSMNQEKADAISLGLIKTFVSYCNNATSSESKKSLEAIGDELSCLDRDDTEGQEMSDTRFAIIFQEIASLLEGQGETLFKKGE